MRYFLACPPATVVFAEPGGERLRGNGVVVIPLRSCYFYFNLSSLWIAAQRLFDCFGEIFVTIFCQPFGLSLPPADLWSCTSSPPALAPLFPPYKKPTFWQSRHGRTPKKRRCTFKALPVQLSERIPSDCANNWQDLESISLAGAGCWKLWELATKHHFLLRISMQQARQNVHRSLEDRVINGGSHFAALLSSGASWARFSTNVFGALTANEGTEHIHSF